MVIPHISDINAIFELRPLNTCVYSCENIPSYSTRASTQPVIKYQNGKIILIYWAAKRIGYSTLSCPCRFLGLPLDLLWFLNSNLFLLITAWLSAAAACHHYYRHHSHRCLKGWKYLHHQREYHLDLNLL